MSVFARWRAERRLQRQASAFVVDLFEEPDGDDVRWLATVGTLGDLDHARWELRYARRALGLIAAQRDALNDFTASAVGRELANSLRRDSNIDRAMIVTAERQFNARLSAYRDGLAARGGVPTPIRMGQTLLAFAGGSFRAEDENVVRAGVLLTRYLAEANEALRARFGGAVVLDPANPSLTGGAKEA